MSMKDIGILDGDPLAVHKPVGCAHGQVVVARIDDEATVKRLKSRVTSSNCCRKTANFRLSLSRSLRQQSFTIEGLAVGVIRNGIM